MMIRRLLVIIAALMFPVCAHAAVGSDDRQPVFLADQFFIGMTTGEGKLLKRSGEIDQRFTVVSHGQYDSEGRFLLKQVISWSDGDEQLRTFVLTPDGQGNFKGHFADGFGNVRLTSEENVGRLRHKLPGLPLGRIEQFMTLQPDGRTVLNKGRVRVLGITVRYLEETITRPVEAP